MKLNQSQSIIKTELKENDEMIIYSYWRLWKW